MRFCIVTDRYAPEARALAVLSRQLAEGLAERGYEVTVVTRMPTNNLPGQQPLPSSTITNGVRIERVRGVSGSWSIAARAFDQLTVSFGILRRLLAMPVPDAIFVYSPPILTTIPVILQKWLGRAAYVLNLHDLYPQVAIDLGILKNPALIWLSRRLESALYRNAQKILIAAPATRKPLVNDSGIPSESVELMYNHVDLAACAADVAVDGDAKSGQQDQFTVLYAGAMGPAQDLDIVIECARAVEGKFPWQFLMAGDGPRADRLRQKAAALSNVRFLGPLDDREYFRAVRSADVCLVPLVAEFSAPAIPGKVSTIMAAGRPLVAAVPEGNDTKALVNEIRCGLVVSAGNVAEFQSALERFYNNPELRSECGANGAAWAALHLSLEGALNKVESSLVQAAAGCPPSRSASVIQRS